MRVDMVTDSNGAFGTTGVSLPYDLVVSPAASNPTSTPVVYSALTTASPRVGGTPDDEPAQPGTFPSVPLNVPIVLPAACTPCNAQIGLIATGPKSSLGSFHGTGPTVSLMASPDGGVVTQVASLTWVGTTPTGVAVDFLIGPVGSGSYYYASEEEPLGAPVDGGVQTLATLNPTVVASAGTTTVNANVPLDGGGAGNYTFDPPMIGALQFPSGNSLQMYPLGLGGATASLFVTPSISGTTLAFSGLYEDTVSWTWSATTALPQSTVTLQAYGAPTITFPGNLTPTTGQITWAPGLNQEIFVAEFVAPGDSGGQQIHPTVCEIITTDGTVDFARLAKLGVTVDFSVFQMALYGFGKIASFDALVDENTLALPDGTQSCNERRDFAFQ